MKVDIIPRTRICSKQNCKSVVSRISCKTILTDRRVVPARGARNIPSAVPMGLARSIALVILIKIEIQTHRWQSASLQSFDYLDRTISPNTSALAPGTLVVQPQKRTTSRTQNRCNNRREGQTWPRMRRAYAACGDNELIVPAWRTQAEISNMAAPT